MKSKRPGKNTLTMTERIPPPVEVLNISSNGLWLLVNEKEYFLKLVENNQQTDVVVLNEEQKPTTDEGGLKLLKTLQQSIKANLAGK